MSSASFITLIRCHKFAEAGADSRAVARRGAAVTRARLPSTHDGKAWGGGKGRSDNVLAVRWTPLDALSRRESILWPLLAATVGFRFDFDSSDRRICEGIC